VIAADRAAAISVVARQAAIRTARLRALLHVMTVGTASITAHGPAPVHVVARQIAVIIVTAQVALISLGALTVGSGGAIIARGAANGARGRNQKEAEHG